MVTPPTLTIDYSDASFHTEPLEFTFGDALYRLLGGQMAIETALDKLQHDRIYGEETLTEFLNGVAANFSRNLIEQDPMQGLLSLILQDDPNQNELRDKIADAYIESYPEDDKFEKVYAYTRKPHIFIAHLLLNGGKWVCIDLDPEKYYYEQMMDLFQGVITFHKPETLTREEVMRIVEKAPSLLEDLEDTSEEPIFWVKDTCSTPKLTTLEPRDYFIENPTEEQKLVIDEFLRKISS